MEITEVRIKLMVDTDDRLQGFCSVTFDNSFVVRDLKIIDGANGPFVAMPSRKLTSHCQKCGTKNHLKAQYCNQCGSRQREDRAVRDAEGRAKLYADIAHPINSQCREMIQNRVIAEFQGELEKSKQPGYVSRYDEDYDDDVDTATYTTEEAHGAPAPHIPTPVSPPPAKTYTEPAQTHLPAPHILSPVPSDDSLSTGGPHFTQSPQRDESRELKDNLSKKPPPRGQFGAGIF